LNSAHSKKKLLTSQKIATSLKEILNKDISRESFLAKFCYHFENLILLEIKTILKKYKKYDLLTKQEKIYIFPNGIEEKGEREGKALGFGENGALRVQFLDTKEVKELYSEEVSIRLK